MTLCAYPSSYRRGSRRIHALVPSVPSRSAMRSDGILHPSDESVREDKDVQVQVRHGREWRYVEARLEHWFGLLREGEGKLLTLGGHALDCHMSRMCASSGVTDGVLRLPRGI